MNTTLVDNANYALNLYDCNAISEIELEGKLETLIKKEYPTASPNYINHIKSKLLVVDITYSPKVKIELD